MWVRRIGRRALPAIAAMVTGHAVAYRTAPMQSAEKPVPADLAKGSASSAFHATLDGFQPEDEGTYPVFTAAEVAKHRTAATGIWVTHGNKVYDVTKFVAQHPGGDKILLAAGGAVDPYWQIYQQHSHKHVRDILATLRIGTLHPDDVRAVQSKLSADDPYSNDPRRHPALIARSVKPFNAEPPAQLLTDSYITPTEIMFTRNHLPVPDVSPSDYRLHVFHETLQDDKSTRSTLLGALTLDDLRAMPQTTIVSAVQCAGNRRGDMTKAKETKGLSWSVAAMANVEFRGVLLRDVLLRLGAKPEDVGNTVHHIQFEGLDKDPIAKTAYGASIPADKGFSPAGDVLLALEMNGKPLNRDHGFPVRAVVPGVTGARQVKWLGNITLSYKESDSLWQTKDYKAFPPYMSMDSVDFESMPAIQEMPVTSAICEPGEGADVTVDADGEIVVKGFAWSGGGRGIARVDVSADGGNTWFPASDLQTPPDNSPSKTRSWGWTLWKAVVPVSFAPGASAAQAQLVCRAVDVSYNTQPDTPLQVWNFRGLVNNAYHRVNVSVKKPSNMV